MTEVPQSLAAYESSAIAAQSSAYYQQVSPVLGQYASLFSNGLQSLSSVLVTEYTARTPATTATSVNSGGFVTSLAVSAATGTSSSSSSAAGATQAPEKIVAVVLVAGLVAGGLGVVAAV